MLSKLLLLCFDMQLLGGRCTYCSFCLLNFPTKGPAVSDLYESVNKSELWVVFQMFRMRQQVQSNMPTTLVVLLLSSSRACCSNCCVRLVNSKACTLPSEQDKAVICSVSTPPSALTLPFNIIPGTGKVVTGSESV